MARPASQGRNVTTARGAAQFGSTEIARRAAQNTGTWAGTVAAVRAAFPNLPLGQASQAASVGYQRARAIGQALTGRGSAVVPQSLGTRKISANVPLGPNELPSSRQAVPHRYVIFVGWVDPSTGASKTHRDVIDSQTPMTRDELIQAARDRTRAAEGVRSPESAAGTDVPDEAITVALISYTFV